ncbi:PucR family transcriptional regulator [Oryzobacter terrae]|uniref:PucR family transcriptional regulator n=1 Tax=Oryzobacter terrae TaxID=1620385 RepID=UPI003671B8D4
MGGWALLLDAQGSLVASVPPSARVNLARVQTELARFAGNPHKLTMLVSRPDESLAIGPVGVGGRTRGYLALGRPQPLEGIERSLVDTATYLLADDLQRTDDLRQAARNDRKAVLQLLLGGSPAAVVRPTATTLGVPIPDGPVRVALLGVPRTYGPELLEVAEEDQALRRLVRVIAELRVGRVAILFPTAEGDTRTLEAILRRVPHGRGAVSDPTEPGDLPNAWSRVQAVFNASTEEPGRLSAASDVADAGLLKHLGTPEARAWSSATLATLNKLDKGSKVDFVQTLRTFLTHNGRADASAAALNIHRHTLRYRMTQIESALGRDLDDPTVRSELWIALQLSQD